MGAGGTRAQFRELRIDSRGCFSSSHALKFNIACLVLPNTIGYDACSGMMLVGGAGGEESCGVVRSSMSVIRQREQEEEREGKPFKPR
jgi:hypothetical protein